jgi:hypothetical protein
MRDLIERSAEISDCGRYRWWLRRKLNSDNNQVVCFVMLNPSTADAAVDDPTIRRCMEFARDWRYSILDVRNLFAYRATKPAELKRVDNPVGGSRGDIELRVALTADLVIAGWGKNAPKRRVWDVEKLFKGKPVYCLGLNEDGSPQHPLYIPSNRLPFPFWNCDNADMKKARR